MGGTISLPMISDNSYRAEQYSPDENAWKSQAPYMWREDIDHRRDQAANRQIFDPTQINQSRADQGQFLSYLNQRARGNAESAASTQFRGDMDQAAQAIRAGSASSSRGMNAGLAQKTYMDNLSNFGLQAGQQQRALHASEQARAEEALMQGQTQMRAQDYQTQQMQMQQQQQNDQMVQYYISLGYSQDEATRQARMATEMMKSQSFNNAQGINAGITQSNADSSAAFGQKLFGGTMSAIGSGMAAGM